MKTPLKQLNNAERDEILLAKKVISQIKDIKINKYKLIINIIPK
jgi:hypothetical protein